MNGDLKNKDVRGLSFAKLSIQTFAASIICQVIFLAISIISARILGPEGKGVLTVIILYPTLLFTFGHLSIYRAITVHLAEKKYKFEDFPASILIFTIIVSVVLILGFIIFFLSFNKFFIQDVNIFIILIALIITPCMMLLQAFYSILQVKGKLFEFNLTQILHTVLILVFLFIALIIFKAGISGAVVAYFLAAFLATFITIYFVRKISKDPWKFNLKVIKALVIDGAKLHIGVIAVFIFLKIDMLMLEYYREASSVGFYSIAASMAGLLVLIPTVTQKVFYSKISGLIDDKTDMAAKTLKVYKHALLPSFVVAAGLGLLAKPLITIVYGVRFLPALVPFLILLPGVLFLWQNNILVYFLVGSKKFLLISAIAAFNSFLNVVLNLILIPRYGPSGAAIASLITYLIVGLANLILFINISKLGIKGFTNKLKVTKEDIFFYKVIFAKVFKKS